MSNRVLALVAASLLLILAESAEAQAPGSPSPPAALATTNLTIPAGDHQLDARLTAPPGQARFPIVVFVSSAGNESELDAVYNQILARAFTGAGIGVLFYDKRGVGRSGGTYTGVDFQALADDAVAVTRYAARLPRAQAVGIWGLSQAGWIIPYAVRQTPELRFAVLVSPPGVNAFEQISYFLRNQTRDWGLTPPETEAADRMHRAVTLYYAGRASYRSAQAEVDRHRNARWFHRVVTDPYWDEMTPEGRILSPPHLAQALRERPLAFEAYEARTSYANFAPVYRALRRLPTLIIYGANDQLIPPLRSQPIFREALRGERRYAHDFLVFEGAGHDITTADGHFAANYREQMVAWARQRFDEPR